MDNYSFPVARGGTRDERSAADKPYSVASYVAQYGVPMEDMQSFFERKPNALHGEVLTYIQREHLSNPDFRKAALSAQVRPYGEQSKAEKMAEDVQNTTAKQAERLRIATRSGAFGETGNQMPAADPAEITAEEYRGAPDDQMES